MTDITPEMLLTILDRPIAYHRIYAAVTGSVTAAVMLSQAMYWNPRTTESDRWFYKTADEWQKETGLSRREQETARRTLKKLAILEEKKQGLPCKIFFRVNIDALYHCIVESAKQDSTRVRNKYGGKRQTGINDSAILDATKAPNNLYTDITPEITSENTTERILEHPLFSSSLTGNKELESESEPIANNSFPAQTTPKIEEPPKPQSPFSPAVPENIGKPIHKSDRPANQTKERETFVAPLLVDHDFLKYLFREMKRLKAYFGSFSDADYESHTKLFIEIACETTTKGDRRLREIQDFVKSYDRYKAAKQKAEEERLQRERQERIDKPSSLTEEELAIIVARIARVRGVTKTDALV